MPIPTRAIKRSDEIDTRGPEIFQSSAKYAGTDPRETEVQQQSTGRAAPSSTAAMDEVAALEQLKSLHQRKTQQIEHVKTLTAEFRQWRGDFTSQLGAQREDMQNMRKQLHEDALKQRSEFQEMQAELQRQLEDLISSNLSAFPVLEQKTEPSVPPPAHQQLRQEPPPPPEPSMPLEHPPKRAGSERRGRGEGAQPAADSSLAVKLSHELGIPVELLASSSSSRQPAPLPAEPEPRRAATRREKAGAAPVRGEYGGGIAPQRARSRDTDDESVASSRYSRESGGARSAAGSRTSSVYSDDGGDDSGYSSSDLSDRSDLSDGSYSSLSDSEASGYSDSTASSSVRGGGASSARGGGGGGGGRRRY
jgi:hypothetical protein